MKPDLQFSVLCDDIRREDNGKFIFLGLFEVIAATNFPATHPLLFIANRWRNGLGIFRQKNRIVSSDNKIIVEEKEVSFELKDTSSSHTVISRFNGITFPVEGKYWVEILLDGDLKQRYSLNLVKAKEGRQASP